MEDQLTQVLLQEFRAFRDTEFSEFRNQLAAWQQESEKRVATLEAQVKDLYGNGRDGRVTIVEKRVSWLERLTWTASGIFMAVQAYFAAAAEWHLWPWKK